MRQCLILTQTHSAPMRDRDGWSVAVIFGYPGAIGEQRRGSYWLYGFLNFVHLTIQHVSHSPSEFLQRKRLLKKRGPMSFDSLSD